MWAGLSSSWQGHIVRLGPDDAAGEMHTIRRHNLDRCDRYDKWSGMEDKERQAIVDEEHLKLLRIGYMVSAGMCAFFSLFGLLYAIMGIIFFAFGSRFPSRPGQEPPPALIGWLFAFFGLGFTLAMLGLAALKFRVAQLLKRRRG